MKIGIPKEIKEFENRVALTPSGTAQLVKEGHTVYIQRKAGNGSGFLDEDYKKAGGIILSTAKEVWDTSEMIVKVKEPLKTEYKFFRKDLLLFTYLHLASNPELTEELKEKEVTAIGYETVQLENGSLPLLIPMSEIAGRMSIQIGMQLLEKNNGGKGILLSGVPGIAPAKVTIIGGGIVGTNAAKMAIGLGADVTILDMHAKRLRELDDLFGGSVKTVLSSPQTIHTHVVQSDLLIGAVLIPGAKSPKLVSESMVRKMNRGSVIIDVAIDQGGSIETIDRITTHKKPTFKKYGVLHYSVANMPGAVPKTATLSLTNATLPYIRLLAKCGIEEAFVTSPELKKGLNVQQGRLVNENIEK